jgi:hypothetical protein
LTLAPRQFVASITAAAVLLCSIVCACGSSLPDPHEPVVSATSPAAVGRHEVTPHCHGHRAEDADHHDGGHGQKPEPCKKGTDHSCSHCGSAVTAVSENGKSITDLSPLDHPVATLLPVLFAVPAVVTSPTRLPALGDPSPPPGHTLLSLHCALNT